MYYIAVQPYEVATFNNDVQKSTFRLRTVFITVCVFITVAITVRVHFAFLLPFVLPLRVHYAFHCFFTLSPVENTSLQVVTMFEGRAALGSGWSLGLAELGLLAKLSVGGGETVERRPVDGYFRGSGVGDYQPVFFFTRVVCKITVFVTVRYRCDSVSITVSLPSSLPFYRATQTKRRLFWTSTVHVRNLKISTRVYSLFLLEQDSGKNECRRVLDKMQVR